MRPRIRNWRLAAIFIVASLFFLTCSVASAEPCSAAPMASQASQFDAGSVIGLLGQASRPEIARGPGGYFSWIKLLCLVVVFLFWVFLTDRMNQDMLRFGEILGRNPEVWNMLNVLGFVLTFFLAISIPIFWISFPLYAIAGLLPGMLYYMTRRGKIKSNEAIDKQIKAGKAAIKSGDAAVAQLHTEPLPQDEGAEIQFSPSGKDKTETQVNLIRARQLHAYPVLKDMVADVVTRRAEIVMLDYTRDAATARMQVDGTWHQLPTLDRQTGDSLLVAAKCLAGLKPEDRRSRQNGKFGYNLLGKKGSIDITTQGIQTGERVIVKVVQKSKTEMNLGQLGMWPDMYKNLLTHLNNPGFVIISAPPQGGLSTSWKATLVAADRVTRDFVSFVPENDKEQDYENITRYNYPQGGTPLDAMRTALMTQPEALVVPHISDAATLDELTRQVIEEGRTVFTHLYSKSASEALLRLYQLAGDKDQFAKAVTAVTCQKMARRLCETCKQQVQVNPQLIQQLGGDPRKQNWVFNHFTGPRPDQVDENGRPIEIPPCKTCNAFGYIGRIAYFELIEVNDQLRQVIKQQPKLQTVAAAAQKLGSATLTQQAYRLVLVGLTSVSEIQQSLKS